MAISKEQESQIKRYYYAESWKVGTISRELGIHHSAIKRVLSQNGAPKSDVTPNPSMIDPFLGFIMEKLDSHPKLTASRLYDMVKERGYPGSRDHFRHLISIYRPKRVAEAYLRLRTLPGEQAQVDWGHFGYVNVGKARRPLTGFVMVLSYSRKIYLQFYLNQRMSNFLHGHENAFQFWGGVPRVLLYDNLKSAVLERKGDAIRFHPTLLDFSAHYKFEARPVAVARGNEKGRVERAIRYIRDNFFQAREWKDVDDLNQQALYWCNHQASDRPCPEERSKTVGKVFNEEQVSLMKLPETPYPAHETTTVKVGKTPYIRFDLNDYSVPHTYVRCKLTVISTTDKVTILDGATIIIEHDRSYDKCQQIEDASHIKELVDRKKAARKHRAQDRLINVIPSCEDFLKSAAARGYNLGSITSVLLTLLDEYGAHELEIAVNDALAREVPHHNAVRINLQRQSDEKNKVPPVRIDISNDQRLKEQSVKVHNLKAYDNLKDVNSEV